MYVKVGLKKGFARILPVVVLVSLLVGCLVVPAWAAGDKVQANLWKRLGNGYGSEVVMVLLKESDSAAYAASMANPASRGQAMRLVAQVQDRVLDQVCDKGVTPRTRYTNIPAFSARVNLKGLNALAALDEVVSVKELTYYYPRTAQGLPLMKAWSTRDSFGGKGVAVAILDTGITRDHEAFIGPDGANKVLGGYNSINDNEDFSDSNGHGTACAAIAAGYDNSHGDYRGGVAPQAKLYGLKGLGEGGGSDEVLAKALDWCISNQFRSSEAPIMIVSASLGGSTPFYAPCDDTMTVMGDALNRLDTAGIAFFAASGNDGWCNAIEDPACLTKAISVGAVYDADQGSNNGTCLHDLSCLGIVDLVNCASGQSKWHEENRAQNAVIDYSDSASFLDLLAPSECVTVPAATVGQYENCFNGTSAATPYAAGAGAVLQARAKELRGSFLTATQLKQLLVSSGDAVSDPKSGVTTPRVNLERALQKLEAGEI